MRALPIRYLVALCSAAALGVACSPTALAANSWATASGVRAQTMRFIGDELDDNGADACAVLNAPLNGTIDHHTCTQRWDASLRKLTAAQRRALRADEHAVPSAHVGFSDGDMYATIALPTPLLGRGSRYYWTDSCWMLER